MIEGKFVFTTLLKDPCPDLKNVIPNGASFSTCSILNAFEVANSSAVFHVAMATDDATKQPLNCLVKYMKPNDSNSAGNWTLRSCLPTYIPIADPNMPFTVVSDNVSIPSTGRATVIKGIQQRDIGGQEYYAFGNALFYR